MNSIRSLRVSLAAFGLLTTLAVPAAFAQSAPGDPQRQPLWQDAAQQVAVLDSLPTRTNRYQLLSFPLVPNPNTVSGIFDELGNYDPARWRLGHWLPSLGGTSKYQEPNQFTTITQGFGYWLITKDSVTVRYDGTAAAGDTIELPLIQAPNGVAEWNQLGNPFNFNSAVVNWRVVKRDSLLTLGQAASRTWIDANMRTWNPNTKQYTASGTIPRGQGFFARLTDPDTSLQWTRWVVDSLAGSTGFWSSVRLDSKGNPHIAFYQDGGIGFLQYATRVNNRWTVISLDGASAQFNGPWASIELDSLDLPHIAYLAAANSGLGRLMYIRQQPNGTWTIPEQIEPQNTGWNAKIKLFHGVPRVAYVSLTDGALKYAEKIITGWNIDPPIPLGAGNINLIDGDIGFDVNKVTGQPHIVSPSTFAPYGLRYSTKTGTTWSSQMVDTLTTGGDTGITPSVALDASGVPSISYYDRTNIDLKFARRSGSSWLIETVDATGNTGNYGELLIKANGTPVIAFLEYASMGVPNRIRLAQKLGGGWTVETVDDVSIPNAAAGLGAYLGATLDAQGNPTVTYIGRSISSGFTQIRMAEKIRGDWRIKIPPVAAPEPPVATLAKPDGSNWAVAITPRQGDRSSEPLMLGAASAGTVLSAINSAAAPAPPNGDALSLSVRGADGPYVRDFQPASSSLRWTFETDGGATPGEQELEITGLDVPAGMKLFLSDPEAGWTREVVSGERVTIAARPRSLELLASSGNDVETRLAGDQLAFAYPNPFQATTGLSFTLARVANIRVDIVDITGRRVRTLSRTAAAAGEHVLVWDGRDESGHAVASGVYLARYQAGAATGSRRLVRVE